MLLFRHFFHADRATIYPVIIMTIYIDTLVIVNTYICWLMLSLCARMTHNNVKPARMVLGAFIGGISSLLILINTDSIILSLIVYTLKLLFLLAVAFSAFYNPICCKGKILTTTAIYVIINIVFGGAIYCAKEILKTPLIYYNSSTFYLDISLTDIIILSAVIYLVLTIAAYFTSRHIDISCAYHVGICLGDESFILEGVADTGNKVSDIFSGKPVVICTGINYSPPETKRVYAVPYNTVNGEGLLYAFIPDSFYIEDEKGKRSSAACLVAFTEGSGRRAVFNPVLLK